MTHGEKSKLLLKQYGSNLHGKSFADIARELGVSRRLVHHVLYPIHGSSQGTPVNIKYRTSSQPDALTTAHVDALNLVAKLFSLEPGDLVEIERFHEGGWGFKIIKADERKEAA